MNWAAWEYRIGVAKRTDQWRMAFRIHPDSARRRPLWSSKDCIPVEPKPRFRKCPTAYSYSYRSGKSFASLVQMQQQMANMYLQPLIDKLAEEIKNDMDSHIMDAMVYGWSMHKAIAWKIGNHDRTPSIKFKFTQRTGEIKCQQVQQAVRQMPRNSTGLDRSQNALLLRERGQTVTSTPAGRPYRMRRRSTK